MTHQTESRPAALEVVFAEGEEKANIVAKLLKQHIDAIVAADPSKVDAARKLRGKLGIHSTEPDERVTLIFDGERVMIRNGFDPDLDGAITGPLKLQTETLAGIANPYREILRRKLKVRFKLTRPFFTSRTYNFLKVPPAMKAAAQPPPA
ncbi:MAG TPA: hypothetical protein VNN12_07725 [Dehalococcoidia bacterium]|nr:hypothetical protein [Dehalococcoidia bacterium]